MGWSTYRTAEMPAVPEAVGRHRKRRAGRVAIAAGVVTVAVAVGAALLVPGLSGRSQPMTALLETPAGLSTVATAAAATPPPPTVPPLTTAAPPKLSAAAPPKPPPPPRTSTTTRPPPRPGTPLPSFEDQVVELVNEERAERGCAPMRDDLNLHQSARDHSMDMAQYLYHSHTGRDGSTPRQRIEAAGYDESGTLAENIAMGYRTPESVMRGWMKSDGHRKNILHCGLRAIGVGAARASNGDIYWTQNFGGR